MTEAGRNKAEEKEKKGLLIKEREAR